MGSNKTLKIVVLVIFILIFGISIYYNVIYFAQFRNSSCAQQPTDNYIVGVIKKIDNNKLTFDVDGQAKDVMLSNSTTYNKSYADPVAGKTISGNKSELKTGMQASVIYKKAFLSPDLTAESVNYVINNMMMGKVVEKSNDLIKLQNLTTETTAEIRLSDNVKYYKLKSADNSELVEASVNDMNMDNQISVFLTDDISSNNYVADKIVIIK